MRTLGGARRLPPGSRAEASLAGRRVRPAARRSRAPGGRSLGIGRPWSLRGVTIHAEAGAPEPEDMAVSHALERELEEKERQLKELLDSRPPPKSSVVAAAREEIASLRQGIQAEADRELARAKREERDRLERENRALSRAAEARKKQAAAFDLTDAKGVRDKASLVEEENAALEELLAIRRADAERREAAEAAEALRRENAALLAKLEQVVAKERRLAALTQRAAGEGGGAKAAGATAQARGGTRGSAAEGAPPAVGTSPRGKAPREAEVPRVESRGPPAPAVVREDVEAEPDAFDATTVAGAGQAEVQAEVEAELPAAEQETPAPATAEETVAEGGEEEGEDEDVGALVEEVASLLEELGLPEDEDTGPGGAGEDDTHPELAQIVRAYEQGKFEEFEQKRARLEALGEECQADLDAFQSGMQAGSLSAPGDAVTFHVPRSALPGSQVHVLLDKAAAGAAGARMQDVRLKVQLNGARGSLSAAEGGEVEVGGRLHGVYSFEVPDFAHAVEYTFVDGAGWTHGGEGGEGIPLECLNVLTNEQCLTLMRLEQLEMFQAGKYPSMEAGEGAAGAPEHPKLAALEKELDAEVAAVRTATEGALQAARPAAEGGECWFVSGAPKPGESIEVFYDNGPGPLSFSSNLDLVWGCNAWSFKADPVALKPCEVPGRPGKWYSAKLALPPHAKVVGFVVRSEGKYDNNAGADFHFPTERGEQSDEEFWADFQGAHLEAQRAEVEAEIKAGAERKEAQQQKRRLFMRQGMQKLAEQQKQTVWTEPASPTAGEPVAVFFEPRKTPLRHSEGVEAEITFNRGSHAIRLPRTAMHRASLEDPFQIALPSPSDAFVIDVRFTGSDGAHDDHEGFGYHLPLEGSRNPERPLHVMHVAVEMAPVAKVGGLGDVVTSLGRAVEELGHIVEVVLPMYDTIDLEKVECFREEEGFHWGGCLNRVYSGLVEDLKVYFLRPENGFFDVGMIYGTDYLEIPMMDSERFGFFSRAALEFVLQTGRQPDVIHCHDWSSAPVARSYWHDYQPYGLPHSSVTFTIHNLGYGQDLIKEAMQFCQRATTVSPTYARQVSGEEAVQHGLQKFRGIRNGIDKSIWSPSEEESLPVQYTADDIAHGKAEAKRALRARLGLQNKDVPLLAVVSRLTLQKGVELMEHALWTSLNRGCQFVLLGSAFDPEMQQHWVDVELNLRHEYHDMARLVFAYDEPLSKLIYAAADMIVVPSVFEPCGLTQLIAMSYGTVPVVRHTGGLRDTVFDVDFDSERAEAHLVEPNGFAFEGNDTAGMDYALHRAIDKWYDDKQGWHELRSSDMRQDWSWNEPAVDYVDLYYGAMER